MPLRDHFRPRLDDVHSWDELHGGWPMMRPKNFQRLKKFQPPFQAPPFQYQFSSPTAVRWAPDSSMRPGLPREFWMSALTSAGRD